MTRFYALEIHGRQGDDFEVHCKVSNHDVTLALTDWAGSLVENSLHCALLAFALQTHADSIHIRSVGDVIHFEAMDFKARKALEECVAKGWLRRVESHQLPVANDR